MDKNGDGKTFKGDKGLKKDTENIRKAKPYSFRSNTAEEALRKIMSAPLPKEPTKTSKK